MGDSDIKNYSERLFKDAGPAVLAWIIEGARRVIAKRFKTDTPQCVEDAVRAYREENDWLGHFLSECCEVDASYTERSGELYQQYRAYSIQNGEYTRSKGDFYSTVEKAGFEKRKENTGAYVYGLKLKMGSDFLEQ